MEPVVLIVLAAVIAALLVSLYSGKRAPDTRRLRRNHAENAPQTYRTCPLCNSPLEKGQNVKTIVYPSKGDTLAEIYGCPYCRVASASVPRICPVCKRPIPPDGFVVARMFKRPDRTHVHVLGCTVCRPGARNT